MVKISRLLNNGSVDPGNNRKESCKINRNGTIAASAVVVMLAVVSWPGGGSGFGGRGGGDGGGWRRISSRCSRHYCRN